MLLGPGFTVENRARVALYDLPARTPPGASPPPSSTAFAPTRPDGEKSQCTYRCVVLPDIGLNIFVSLFTASLNAPTGAWCSLTPASESGGMTPLRGPGAPPAPGAPLRTGQHRAQTST